MNESFNWPAFAANNAIGPDYPPSDGDEQIEQQKKKAHYNQPNPTALREILMYTRHIRQQLDFLDAAVHRLGSQ